MPAQSVIVKMVASLAPAEDDAAAPYGSFDVVLSTPTEDRDGEEVKTEEWQQPLPEHITFDVDHGMSVEKTIGSGRPFINDDGHLQVKGTYASTPLAQMTRTLVNEGHIRSTSVTFMRRDAKDAQGKSVLRRELLNGAFVSVPANPEAVVLASKSLADLTAKATKSDRLQAIHDLAVQNGAKCAGEHAEPKNSESGKAATDPETKAAAPAPAMSPAEVDALIAEARATAATSDLL